MYRRLFLLDPENIVVDGCKPVTLRNVWTDASGRLNAVGGLTGALVGLGVSRDKAIRYESDVKAGKFLVTLRGDATQIRRARSLFTAGKVETTEVVQAPAA
jgi:hypothetical protein